MRRVIGVLLSFALVCSFLLPSYATVPIIYSHATGAEKPRVALTFDDGPHPRYTKEILAILAQYGVSATFFAVGENAKAHPELIRAEIEAGHEVGNHTYSHQRPVRQTQQEILEDIHACSEVLREITNTPVRLFRPPEGVCSEGVKQACGADGLAIVLWSIDTRDWAHTPTAEICKNVKQNVRDGSIILMHDFIGKNSPTPEALRQMIPMLLKLGYELVTVGQLLEGAE